MDFRVLEKLLYSVIYLLVIIFLLYNFLVLDPLDDVITCEFIIKIDSDITYTVNSLQECYDPSLRSIFLGDILHIFLYQRPSQIPARRVFKQTKFSKDQLRGLNTSKGCDPFKDRNKHGQWYHPCGRQMRNAYTLLPDTKVCHRVDANTCVPYTVDFNLDIPPVGYWYYQSPVAKDTDKYVYWAEQRFEGGIMNNVYKSKVRRTKKRIVYVGSVRDQSIKIPFVIKLENLMDKTRLRAAPNYHLLLVFVGKYNYFAMVEILYAFYVLAALVVILIIFIVTKRVWTDVTASTIVESFNVFNHNLRHENAKFKPL